jgi:hypothetical protein
MMIFIKPYTTNHSELTKYFDLCYDHFCTAGFQLNVVAFFKRHLFLVNPTVPATGSSWQPRDVDRDCPRLTLAEQLRRRSPPRLILEIDIPHNLVPIVSNWPLPAHNWQ